MALQDGAHIPKSGSLVGKERIAGKQAQQRFLHLNQTDLPMCGTCQYAKQTMRPTGATRKQPRKDKEGGLSDGCLAPVNRVTIDQFEVSKKGRQFSTAGKEQISDKFVGGTIFVDIASGRFRYYF